MNALQAIGIMSGSSLDGLDICAAGFTKGQQWAFNILANETIPFPDNLKSQLSVVRSLSGEQLHLLDIELGEWIGKKAANFIHKHDLKPHVIGSHGHTVFHQPEKKLSLQIGNAHAIAKNTDVPVVADFRQSNVIYEGQGAPLVPIGDVLLFGEYAACINLGGIANISFHQNGDEIIAGDVVPCNQVLNKAAGALGFAYDDRGNLARQGEVIPDWLEFLNDDSFYKKPLPKSISNEWVEQKFLKKIPKHDPKDLLHTFCHHIGHQLSMTLKNVAKGKVLLTGGGAYNDFLVECLQQNSSHVNLVIPSEQIIEGKEALIFAFMAALKQKNEINCLASYTGANKDLSVGVIYLP